MALTAESSVANGWLTARLRMARGRNVDQFVRHFRLAGGEERRAFQTAPSRVKT